MASDIMKQGYVKFQSKNLGVWKKRWLILRAQTKNGPVRLEKYEDECTAAMSGKCRTFILTDILTLYRVPDVEKRHAIHVDVDQYESIQFCLDSEGEANLWLKKIEAEIAEAYKSKNSFAVYILKNPKLPIHGDCTLELTSDSVRLLNHRDQEIVAWPLNKLRRYAVERNLFKIEAGRSCPTGEGEFVFETEEAQDIYDRIHNLTKTQAFTKKMSDMKINQENKSNEKRCGYSSKSKSPRSIHELSDDIKISQSKKNDYGPVGKYLDETYKNYDDIHQAMVLSVTVSDDEDDQYYAEVRAGKRK